jgi:hypothetical protein
MKWRRHAAPLLVAFCLGTAALAGAWFASASGDDFFGDVQ